MRYLKRAENGRFDEFRFLSEPSCCAKFSPDQRFVVYYSTVSGRGEIWVSRFPTGGGKWQVSDAGGRQPRWSHDGTEIFYVEGDALASVEVKTSPSFSTGQKRVLFRSESFLGSYNPQYDVTENGQRFVVAEPFVEDAPAAIRVVQNWYEEFRHP